MKDHTVIEMKRITAIRRKQEIETIRDRRYRMLGYLVLACFVGYVIAKVI